MSTISNAMRTGGEGLNGFFDDVEELLGRITHLPDSEIAELRDKVESSLGAARGAMESSVQAVVDKTTRAVKATDDLVQTNPWKALGIAAVTCLALGALLRKP
jgi:ElaB/YqjD/DUF883 family membrane-anchored ribosome-binding protein